MSKKSFIQENQGDTLSHLLTRERLRRSGVSLKDTEAPSQDPDIEVLRQVLRGPQYKPRRKAAGLALNTVKKLIG
jgi:hypothetical protein